ncbi:MAG: S41 family peptidase [Anaerolineales bacterium]
MDFRGSRFFPFIVAIALLMASCGVLSGEESGGNEDDTRTFSPAESQFPPADFVNDEGGATSVGGELFYTNPFFTAGVAEPLVILEDQAGFVDRDRNFIFPIESQVLGQITSDFYTSPFTYKLTMPEIPEGTLRDVDLDSEDDPGVMVFAVAYWTNIWGDPYLEKRDQYGGGWSTAYASSLVSDDRDSYREVYGGKYLVYAPDYAQGFPSGFGDDGLLFTDDDPIVGLPQGWTLVDMDSDPFIFDRSSTPDVTLLEPEQVALDDFSGMGYVDAFDAILEKMRTEYAFTEHKSIDWEAMENEYRPKFEQAEKDDDSQAYLLALRDFLWSIPDGHISMDTSVFRAQFQEEVAGGFGLSIQELDDGRVLVNHIVEDGPADLAGIEFGAEIFSLNDEPIVQVLRENVPWSSPFSTEHTLRQQQGRYAIRFPLGTVVDIAYANPGGVEGNATLGVVSEYESFDYSSLYKDVTGLELPVEFEILDEGYGYVKMASFFDNEVLTIQLWERMMEELNDNGIPGLIIDLRNNGGGSGFLADQMAAYFFHEEILSGNTGFYDDSTGEFYTDPGDEDYLFPPREELRYDGSLAVLVGPACASACEFFAYDLTLEDRATIIGQYPSAGLGGSVEDFIMPEENTIRFTIGRAVNPEGEIHIEGTGVVPDVRVPITEESTYAVDLEGRDIVLEEALKVIAQPRGSGVIPEGLPRVGSVLESQNALQSETPLLDDLAIGSDPGDPYAPGTSTFTISLSPSQDAIWATGWCAAPDRFDENWENIEVLMSLDGEEIPLELFVDYEFEVEDQECLYYFTVLSDWPVGEHLVRSIMDFKVDLDDGITDVPYPVGERIFEYVVVVND